MIVIQTLICSTVSRESSSQVEAAASPDSRPQAVYQCDEHNPPDRERKKELVASVPLGRHW